MINARHRSAIGLIFVSLLVLWLVLDSSGSSTDNVLQFQVKGKISGPRHSVAAGVKVHFDSDVSHRIVITDDKGFYETTLSVGAYTMKVDAPNTKSRNFSIFKSVIRPLFEIKSPTTVTLNGTLFFSRLTCDIHVTGNSGQTAEEEREAVSKDICGGEDCFDANDGSGVPFQVCFEYPKRQVVDHMYVYKADKIYDTEPPVPVFVAYNLFSLQASEVTYNSTTRIVTARGNLVFEDQSGRHHADLVRLKFENGRVLEAK